MQKHDAYVLIFEGLDASGKTTLSNAVHDYLKENNSTIRRNCGSIYVRDVINFPNYKSIAGGIITRLLHMELKDIQLCQILASAFALDRMIYEYPNMNNSSNIYIFNRYYPSNFAYNYSLDLDFLIDLESESYIGNKVFILDIDPKTSVKRRPERRDNYEKDLEYLKNVRKAYLELAHRFGWVVLDGTKPTDKLVKEVIKICVNSNDGLEFKPI